MRIRMVESYLTEDIEAVKRQYSYVPAEEFDFIIRLDPTFNENRDSVGKYGKWLLGLYKKDDVLLQRVLTAYRDGNNAGMQNWGRAVTDTIQKYDNAKNDRTVDIEKDISKIKSLKDMLDLTQNAGIKELSKRQKSRMIKQSKDYDLVFENDKYYVFVPKNHAGDMQLASYGHSEKATWCTAVDDSSGEGHYDYYLKSGGYYYVIINKNDYNEKYQFHFESKQFMDKNDHQIDVQNFYRQNPDIEDFLMSDKPNREKATLEREGLSSRRFFRLDPDISDDVLNETRVFEVDKKILARAVYDNLRGDYNSEFCLSVESHILYGDSDFDLDTHYVDWKYDYDIPIQRSSVEQRLKWYGLTDTMIDDFCGSISGFMSDLQDGVYDGEENEDGEPIEAGEIYSELEDVLDAASCSAHMVEYGDQITEAVDTKLQSIGIRWDYIGGNYSVVNSYLGIYTEIKKLQLECNGEVSVRYDIDPIEQYIETLISCNFVLEEPYYGFSDSPSSDLLREILVEDYL